MAGDAGAVPADEFRAGVLWRLIVGLGSSAVAVALVAAVAEAWSVPDARWVGAFRGLAIAAIGAGSLLGVAFVLRLGFVRAGIPADEPFIPHSAPAALRSSWERGSRSRAAAAAVVLGVGLLVGFLTAGLDGDGDGDEQVAADRVVRLESGSSVAGKERTRGGSRGSGDADDGTAGGADDGSTDDGDSTDGGGGSGDGSDDGSDDGAASGSGGGGSGGGGGGGGSGGGGTTTTTRPGSDGDYPCDVLDEYTGDVDELLESLGIDEDEITDETCDEIEQALEDADETLGDILEDLFGILPIPIPTVTTTTVTLPVTTTTVTVPSLPVTTTTVTLPNLGL